MATACGDQRLICRPTMPPHSGAGALAETLAPDAPSPLGQRGGIGDRYGGVQLAFGIAAALYRRSVTGEGSIVDVSLLSAAMWSIASDFMAASLGIYRPGAIGADRTALFNPLAANYKCADGRWLMLCCMQPDRNWLDVCRVLGAPDLASDQRFVDTAARTKHSSILVPMLRTCSPHARFPSGGSPSTPPASRGGHTTTSTKCSPILRLRPTVTLRLSSMKVATSYCPTILCSSTSSRRCCGRDPNSAPTPTRCCRCSAAPPTR